MQGIVFNDNRGGFEADRDLDGNRHRLSLDFNDDAGKISNINFWQQDDNKKVDLEIASFEGSEEEAKGGRRSNFNEELLQSSGSEQERIDGVPSREFVLKPSNRNGTKISKDIEISIDIEWPAERIQQEYQKHQTKKNQLLFGPNWSYKGEQLDLDNAKKEVYLWKRDEEMRRSMAFA
jgi:hypothetical protein